MGYGGFSPQPERYGGARPTVEFILRSLNAQMGTAYDVTAGSPVFMRNLALARCLADVWDTSERMANQFDPYRMSEFLPRWEKILGIIPLPTDTDVARRQRVQAKFARMGRMPTAQAISDQLTRVLAPITFVIVTDTAATAEIAWPYAMGRIYSLGTSPPTVTVSGVPTGTERLKVIIDGAGTLGVATFQWSLDDGGSYSASTPTAASFPIPGSPLTLAFSAGTYSTDNIYSSQAYPDSWTSTTALISIQCTKPTAMTEAEFYQRLGEAWVVLDDYMPAWGTFNFSRGEGFYLDAEANLDNARFDV